jgi:hypothetical protein
MKSWCVLLQAAYAVMSLYIVLCLRYMQTSADYDCAELHLTEFWGLMNH